MAAESTPVRVRFAPSPTGHLHIGGLRTALFNLLFARHHKGQFLLRIEDTDVLRSFPEYTASILESLAWANIESDEPVITQTHFIHEHMKLAHMLLEAGKAYRCFCPKQEYVEGSYGRYDGRCRDRVPTEQELAGPYAIRLKLPLNLKTIEFTDLIRGNVSFDSDQFDDFIIVRSDGVPVYNFVVVADDCMMRITHVIRGEEHVSNTPRQILIYNALGKTPPIFAHLPMILGPTGAKLSKRDAATSVLEYRAQGYLPDALCNYLARLGWSYGDRELFSRQEMIDLFSLENVGSKGSIFDKVKLDWVNGVYLRQTSGADLLVQLLRWVSPDIFQKLSHWSEEKIIFLIDLYKERVKTLGELSKELQELYHISYDSLVKQQLIEAAPLIALIEQELSILPDFSSKAVQACIKELAQKKEKKMADFAQPIRLAVTGKSVSPGVFELMSILGRDEVMRRLKAGAQQD